MLSAAQQNPYSAAIQNVSFLVQLPTLHCIRAFLRSGPPATKTVVHGLLVSLTYSIQAMQIHLFGLTNLGYLTGKYLKFVLNKARVTKFMIYNINIF